MKLTKTEHKIAELVTRGYSEKEIASQLYVSPKTIHNHTYNIRKKWDARSAVDVCRKFILSLENPKEYFAALFFLLIQINMTFASVDIDMRKTPRRSRTKIVRITSRKYGNN
jgi:DNA-binding CsgD family transcriptional regulator